MGGARRFMRMRQLKIKIVIQTDFQTEENNKHTIQIKHRNTIKTERRIEM